MSWYQKLLFPAFLVVFGLSYVNPITEGDFFWHLNAGQALWEGGLSPGARGDQWLGQVLLYLVWSVSGFSGIVYLRVGVYAAILAFAFFWMRRAEVPFYVALFLCLLSAHLLLSFPSERPQLFSFLLFPITISLLERFRERPEGRTWWFLPGVILLWSQIHPGYLTGLAAVFLYSFPSLLRSLIRHEKGRVGQIIVVLILPVLVLALLHPGTLSRALAAALSLFTGSEYTQYVQEYLSPVTAALELGQIYPSYWAFLILSVILLLRGFRRIPIEHTLLHLFFIALSLRSLRFMPFLLLLSPLTAQHAWRKREGWEKNTTLFAGFSVVLALWLLLVPLNLRTGISGNFPEGAAGFVGKRLPRGAIFNYQGWAGYLSWTLNEREIFMPVQSVTVETLDTYSSILWDDGTRMMGIPAWKAILDAYRLDIVLMPGMSPVSGEIFPLVRSLVLDGDWYLVYSDATANVFVRAMPNHLHVITRYSLPKQNVYLQIADQAKRLLQSEPQNEAFRQALETAKAVFGGSLPERH
jgi:hypothetical protein